MRKFSLVGLALAALLVTAGCGQEIKKENEQLKAQVSAMTAENADLLARVEAMTKEGEDLRAQVAGLTAELDATRQRLADAKKPRPVKKTRR